MTPKKKGTPAPRDAGRGAPAGLPLRRPGNPRILSMAGLPRTNAVAPATAVPALLDRIDALEAELADRPTRHAPDVEAEIEGIRLRLLQEARKMIPEAVKKARAGKPDLLRLIHRIAR